MTGTTDVRNAPKEFLDRQVALLAAGDTVGLSMRYAEDATFVKFDRVAHGRDEIRALFDDYVRENPEITTMDGVQITDDVILYQAAERLSGVLTTAVGSLVFKDGLVWRQTAAFVEHRPS
jgi:ketosteroid isomerase-like protein